MPLHQSAPQRWLEAWRKARDLKRDFAGCSGAEIDRVLFEAGLTRSDLENMARHSYGPDNLLPQRLAAEGIDADKLHRFEAAVYREIYRVCAGCRSVGRCESDLQSHDAIQADWRSYCLNADTITALSTENKPG
jgi:hypothetical protein